MERCEAELAQPYSATGEDAYQCSNDGTYRPDLDAVLCDEHNKSLR